MTTTIPFDFKYFVSYLTGNIIDGTDDI